MSQKRTNGPGAHDDLANSVAGALLLAKPSAVQSIDIGMPVLVGLDGHRVIMPSEPVPVHRAIEFDRNSIGVPPHSGGYGAPHLGGYYDSDGNTVGFHDFRDN